jgi:hypothetical protein
MLVGSISESGDITHGPHVGRVTNEHRTPIGMVCKSATHRGRRDAQGKSGRLLDHRAGFG